MSQSLRRAAAVAALVALSALTAVADVSRLSGPTTIATWPVVLFDAAFDSVNQVYLVVWGPHSPGPARGQFLNAGGAPIGGSFPVSAGTEWSGWARVAYSEEQQTFLVAYTKIVGSNLHQRTARLVTYNAGSPNLGGEIFIDTFGGAPGVDAGDVAYSPGANVFLVSWREWESANPESFVAAVTPGGAVGTRHLVSNPGDGQSNPFIACNDAGRCLVVGWAWGAFAGGVTSIWGRFVDGPDATPAGPSSFYIDSFAAITAGEVAVTYSPQTGNFFTASTRNGSSVWGKAVTASGGLGTASLLKQSVNPAIDGGGYGVPSLAYNAASQTMLLTMGNWFGTGCAQELSAAGVPTGPTDCVPFPAADNTGFNVAVADSVNSRFLMLDNQDYNAIRATVYQATASSSTPIAPAIATHPQSQTIPSGTSTTLSVVATGTAPLGYQWYQGAAPDTTTPVGTNSATFTTPVLSGVVSYWVRVTNSAGSANSNTATISATGGGGGTGGMTRTSGPTTVVSWPLVLFDAAFDTVNQVYLVVWGPHAEGPARGQFLNALGAPIGTPFPVSGGTEWSGWARVAYSEEQQKFLVAYTKILGPSSHQRTARFVTYNGGSPGLGGEIFIDTFAGAPGVDAGDVEYSPGANTFLVAWREAEPGRLPESFVAAVSPAGAVGTRHLVSNPGDGQSDPKIACSDSGRCLVAGWAWGQLAGNTTSIWGRFVDGPDATPAGASSFYIDSFSAITAGEVAVTYNRQTGNFFTASTRNGSSVWGKVVSPSGGLGTAFLLKQSVNPAVDGGGYGVPSLVYNAASQTMLLTMGNWFGTACAQELSLAGVPLGATDCVPFPALDNTGFNVATADPINARFLMLDNYNYGAIRATVYQTTPVSQAPVITGHPASQNVAFGGTATLSVTATGTAPFAYQWFHGNSGNTSAPIGGATSSSYTTPALTNVVRYWVRVTNAHGSADSAAARVTPNQVTNGGFASGSTGWLAFGAPVMDQVQWGVSGGVMHFYRKPDLPGGGNQATVFQHTGRALAANTPIEARFQLGNASTVRRRITVVLVDSDFSDLQACSFWLEPSAPLATYAMRTHTVEAWTNASIYFYAATPGWDGGYYQIDNVTLAHDPWVSPTRTECDDPTDPVPSANPNGPNLIENPIFFANAFEPWVAFGQVVHQVVSGVAEFYRTAGDPAGVIMQATTQPMAQGEIMTAWFKLGNSSGVRKRVTVLLHDQDFDDLQMCTFWLAPGQGLVDYSMRTAPTRPWTNTSISFYAATVGADPWIRLDDVVLMRTPSADIVETECLEPGSAPPHPGPTSLTGTSDSGGASRTGTFSLAPSGSAVAPARTSSSPRVDAGTGEDAEAENVVWTAIAYETGVQRVALPGRLDPGGIRTARLIFESRLASNGSAAEIEISTDGVTWQTLVVVPPSGGWEPIELALGAWTGAPVQLRLVFHAVAPPAGVPPDIWQLRGLRIER